MKTNAKPLPPPLEQVTKPSLTTGECAHYLNRQPQTLRCWACYEDGPIRPIRINGRLAWAVTDLRRILNVKPEVNHAAKQD